MLEIFNFYGIGYGTSVFNLLIFSKGEGFITKLGNVLLTFLFSFVYFFVYSIGFRGSRESLHSGMTYSARRGSNASMYEGDYFVF